MAGPFIHLVPDDRQERQTAARAVAGRAAAAANARLLRSKLAGRLPIIPVAEFPKAGGTWFGQVLSTYLGVPFPQRALAPAVMRCVLHGHFDPPVAPGFLVVRDPRDCYVSLFHHRRRVMELNAGRARFRRQAARWEQLIGSDLLRADGTSAAVGRYFELLLDGNQLIEPDWAEYHRRWLSPITQGDVVVARYEELRADPMRAFATVIERRFGAVDVARLAPSVDRYAFDTVRGGHEAGASFVRQGALGGWRVEVPEELHQRLDQLVPRDLAALGYG